MTSKSKKTKKGIPKEKEKSPPREIHIVKKTTMPV
jgi:hypothetical protein